MLLLKTGQTESHAIVVEKFEDVKQLKETGQLDFSKDIVPGRVCRPAAVAG